MFIVSAFIKRLTVSILLHKMMKCLIRNFHSGFTEDHVIVYDVA
jgi:hypothetical protein